MSLLVGTSVWSLAFRRDTEKVATEVKTRQHALEGADQVFTTGLVLQAGIGRVAPLQRAQHIVAQHHVVAVQKDVELLRRGRWHGLHFARAYRLVRNLTVRSSMS